LAWPRHLKDHGFADVNGELLRWKDSEEAIGFGNDRRDVLGGAGGRVCGQAVGERLRNENVFESAMIRHPAQVYIFMLPTNCVVAWEPAVIQCRISPAPGAESRRTREPMTRGASAGSASSGDFSNGSRREGS
jgi:hypothetical protein